MLCCPAKAAPERRQFAPVWPPDWRLRAARVLCIDLDVGLRNLDIALGLAQVPALSFPDVSEGGEPIQSAARHPAYETLFFLTAPVGRSPRSWTRRPLTE